MSNNAIPLQTLKCNSNFKCEREI